MSTDTIKRRIQATLEQRGGGVLTLSNCFKEFDIDNSGQLSWEEFCGALRKCGLTPSVQDIRALFLECDKDGNNEISYEEFVNAFRGTLSAKRIQLISRIFKGIDKDGDGIISMTDIGTCFNPKNHPSVVSGASTIPKVLTEFLDSISTVSSNGTLSQQQFIEYYGNVCAFDDDVKFEALMYSLWTVKSDNSTLGNTGPVSLQKLIQKQNNSADAADNSLPACMTKLREQLAARGARGIVGLSRKFRIIDDDNSKSINMLEFRKAISECALNVSEKELSDMFNFFDKDHNGYISFDEFLSGIRGVLNPRRRRLVQMAFSVLDKDGNGIVDPEELVGRYDASKHPEVIAGKKSPDEVLREFLDTFDVGGEKDGKVTAKEFENYYANISASIDDDDYFELMIRNAWHISGGTGWSANSANRRVLVTDSQGRESVQEIKNDLGLKADDKKGMMDRLRAQGSNVSDIGMAYGDQGREKSAPAKGSLATFANSNPIAGTTAVEESIASAGPSAASNSNSPKAASTVFKDKGAPTAGVAYIVQKLTTEFKQRGARGFVGLQRKFRIIDDDGSKSLSLLEWKKAMKECNMKLNDQELRLLFDFFDSDRSGFIDFEEFIQGVRDPLNDRRRRLVQMAFNLVDVDGNGQIDVSEIATKYDATKHPEVIAGRMTADQVFREFLDTFDVGGEKDGKVTAKEFENYYTNLGANIDNDDYFELMIRNAWHISGGTGWSANSANRRVLVTDSQGRESVQEIKNDLGLKADDKKGMMDRLQQQGVHASSISLYDGSDNTSAPSKPRARPLGGLNSGGASSAPQVKSLSSTMASRSTSNHLPAGGNEVIASRRGYVNSETSLSGPQNATSSNSRHSSAGAGANMDKINSGLQLLIQRLKAEFKARGAIGFIGLQRKFRIIDDDGSKSLCMNEFKKAMKECALDLSEPELRLLFNHFDTDGNGSIDFEEFIQGVRDPLSDRRLKLVNMAFDILDKEHRGHVLPEDLIGVYDTSKHPDVLAGRKTAKEMLQEFLDTFDVGGEKDGKVTRQEFTNYYTNLSANIDDEDYFELMIRNAWHITGGKGWCENSSNRRVLVTLADGSQSVQEIKNDLGLQPSDKEGMIRMLRNQGIQASDIVTFGESDSTKPNASSSSSGGSGSVANKVTGETFGRRRFAKSKGESSVSAGLLPGTSGTQYGSGQRKKQSDVTGPIGVGDHKKPVLASKSPTVGVQNIVARIKAELANRGARGFVGMQRKFRIIDDDGNHQLDRSEFSKAMKEMNLGLSDVEMRMIFNHFDVDGSGGISFEEFIQGLRDPLTERRRRLVKLAFETLDVDGSGDIDVSEIAGKYDATCHPEVIAGRMTADQVFREFLDTFDVGGEKDGRVTENEFENYYTNLGANIDNDDYFELMIRNAWHISGGTGWSANSANRRVLVTDSQGRESVQEIKNDLGLKANDKKGMMDRLQQQGVHASSISLFDGSDDTGAKTGKKFVKPAWSAEPSDANTAGVSSGNSRVSSVKDVLSGNAQPRAVRSSHNGGMSGEKARYKLESSGDNELLSIVARLKGELKKRGGPGFLGLQRKFRILDDDGSKSLNMKEFKKGMQECNIDLSDHNLRRLFNHFDADNNGSIGFEEFIQGVRDPLTERRSNLVNMAFDVLDIDGSGFAEAEELMDKYDASKHPDVIAGKKTPQQVMREWLSTFEVGGVVDGKVTRQEFVNYYTNLGANIDDDDYFELMIRNAWHISGGTGWSANSANRRVLVTDSQGRESVQEIKNDLGLKANDKKGMMDRLQQQGVHASSISLYDGSDNTNTPRVQKKFGAHQPTSSTSSNVGFNAPTGGGPTGPNFQPARRRNEYSGQKSSIFIGDDCTEKTLRAAKPAIRLNDRVGSILVSLKAELRGRAAAKGFIGLQRKFRIMDDDNSKSLSKAEFKKAMREMNLDLNDEDFNLLFSYFDADGSGTIDFDEFIYGTRGDLSQRRKNLIQQAFNILDQDGSGEITPDELIGRYDTSRHPDVIQKKKTPEQVMSEFLDTFDVGGEIDGKVTAKEFENYYANISASIDDDDYFELMMRNAWHISGGTGWSANSANRRVLVTNANGDESVREIKNDLGLRANDKKGMMDRLRAEGSLSDGQSISLFGGADNTTKPRRGTTAAPRSQISFG